MGDKIMQIVECELRSKSVVSLQACAGTGRLWRLSCNLHVLRCLGTACGVLLGMAVLTFGNIVLADEERPIEAEVVQLGRPVEFERDIYPILEANCIACHNQALNESDLILEDSEAIMKGGSAGPSVVAGKPEESLLFKVAARIEEPVMPPWPNDVQARKLTPKELGLLKQWIIEGAAGGSGAKSAVMNWQPINSQLKAVYSVDIDPNGRFIAAGRAGGVAVYDMASKAHVVHLSDPAISLPDGYPAAAHQDFVHAIAFHPSGDLLATSGYREVKLWKRQTAEAAGLMTIPADGKALAISADGTQVAVAIAGADAALLNAANGEVIRRIETDGQTAVAAAITAGERPLCIIAMSDGRLQTNLLESGELLHRSESLPSPVQVMTGQLTAGRIAALCADGVVRLLQLAADTGAVSVSAEMKSDSGAIQQVAGDASVVLTVTGQKVEVWNTGDAARIGAFDLPAAVTWIDVSAALDRAVMVLADGQTLLWSLKDGKQIALLNTDMLAVRSANQAEALKLLREARSQVLKTTVAEAEKEVTAQQEAEKKTKEELEKAIAATTEAKGKLEPLVAATAAAKAALEGKPEDAALKKAVENAEKAEAAAKEALATAEPRQQLAQKSVEFATAAVTRAEQRVVERKQQQQTAQTEAETTVAAAAAAKAAAAATVVVSKSAVILTDRQLVASVDAVGTVRLWNAVDGQAVDVLPAVTSLNEGTNVGQVVSMQSVGTDLVLMTDVHQRIVRSALPGWTLTATLGPDADGQASVFVDRVLSLAFSPDGNLLAAGGGEASRSGQVMVWNVADRTLVREFMDAHSDTVYGVEFSPDGKQLATASADKFAKVFDVATGDHVQSYEGHTHHVMDVSWKADLTLLASAGADNAIKVWNTETGEQTRTISTYSKQVTSLNFVGMTEEILSSSGDKRVFLHKASNGGAVREFKGNPDYVYRVASTPDGALVVAGGEDGVLRVWNGRDAKELATFAP